MFEVKVTIGLDAETKGILQAFLSRSTAAAIAGPVVKTETATPTKKATTTGPAPQAIVGATPQRIADTKAETTDTAYDIEDVRGILADAKHKYGLAKVQAALKKYGDGKLASVPADNYGDLVKDIQALEEE